MPPAVCVKADGETVRGGYNSSQVTPNCFTKCMDQFPYLVVVKSVSDLPVPHSHSRDIVTLLSIKVLKNSQINRIINDPTERILDKDLNRVRGIHLTSICPVT